MSAENYFEIDTCKGLITLCIMKKDIKKLFTEAVTGVVQLKRVFLKSFTKFTGKHLCRRLHLNKDAGLQLN